ncbi:uncharacterized protein LOC125195184 [Salvia hispanica]|uniref:uncharacterized protein LOC125195184 n=1 Tax=Salvia hispanica TaxID=49212 RepID=UPI002009CF25|nr:uncharacterized protein LOC125195184 [Salvia hispanica]
MAHGSRARYSEQDLRAGPIYSFSFFSIVNFLSLHLLKLRSPIKEISGADSAANTPSAGVTGSPATRASTLHLRPALSASSSFSLSSSTTVGCPSPIESPVILIGPLSPFLIHHRVFSLPRRLRNHPPISLPDQRRSNPALPQLPLPRDCRNTSGDITAFVELASSGCPCRYRCSLPLASSVEPLVGCGSLVVKRSFPAPLAMASVELSGAPPSLDHRRTAPRILSRAAASVNGRCIGRGVAGARAEL